MPVSLLAPKALAWLGLTVPLVVLYLLKVRRTRQVVPSTWLWAAAARDLRARKPFQRLVAQVPLFLQLLALVLLALALARPVARGSGITGDHVAIVIDVSASMGAHDLGGRTRLDLAKDAARDLVHGLAPGADALVLEAGRDARIASPLDRDQRRLEAAIDRLQAEDVEGDLGRSLAVASDRLRQLPGERRVFVITDGSLSHPDALATVALPTQVVRVGSARDNVAITRIDVRSGRGTTQGKDEIQAFAVIANLGGARREVFATLTLAGSTDPLASRKLALEPGERAPVVLSFEPERGDVGAGLVLAVDSDDALPLDDRVYARVPAGRRLPVVMAPARSEAWLERALLADPDVELSGTSVEGLASADVPADALVVVVGACPAALPGADLLIVAPPAGACRGVVVGAELDRLEVTSWNQSDERLRFLTLDGVGIERARALELGSPGASLLRTRSATVAADVSSPGRSGTLLAFEPADSNWPLRASFVLFVRNVLELARAHRAAGPTGSVHTGEPVTLRVPLDVSEVSVAAPGADHAAATRVPARGGLVILPEVTRAGLHHASWQGARPGSTLVVANLASESESNLAVSELVAPSPSVSISSGAAAAPAEDYGYLLAALALGFVLLDAWWLTRRPRAQATLVPRAPDRRARDVAGGAT